MKKSFYFLLLPFTAAIVEAQLQESLFSNSNLTSKLSPTRKKSKIHRTPALSPKTWNRKILENKYSTKNKIRAIK